jgi:hypothetical protein
MLSDDIEQQSHRNADGRRKGCSQRIKVSAVWLCLMDGFCRDTQETFTFGKPSRARGDRGMALPVASSKHAVTFQDGLESVPALVPKTSWFSGGGSRHP